MKFTALKKVFDPDLIEEGAWLHLVDENGDPLYLEPNEDPKLSKFPCRFRVRSTLSKVFDENQDDLSKKAMNRARRLKGQAQHDAMQDELKKESAKNFSVLVSYVENIDDEQPGEGGKATRAELLEFALDPHNAHWVKQALTFAGDNSNYGGKSATTDPLEKAPSVED